MQTPHTAFFTTEELPPEESRCTDVLHNILRGYAGIREADFDIDKTQLNVVYDPRILTSERAMQLVQRAGKMAGARVAQCAVRGDAACATCALHLNEQLSKHLQSTAGLEFQPAGYNQGVIEVKLNTALPGSNSITVEGSFAAPAEQAEKRPAWSRRQLEILFTAINVVAIVLAFAGGWLGMAPAWQATLYGVAYLFGGFFGLIDGVNAMREEHKLDVNLLMILAALGAAFIHQPLEGAVLLFLFSLSNTLQTFALERNRNAIGKLLDLRPPMATVRRGSRLANVAVEKLRLGDVVVVRPGERFPIDGEVVTGDSDVDQSTITGESIPVHKSPGDAVFASTVNGNGAVEVRVTRLAQDTTLARIVHMVEEAQNNKARTQTMIDHFEQVYAWFVLGGAVLLILVPILLMGHAFYPTFYRAMTWLVVASPCALVISTPASILSGIANGARKGVLFKGGVHLEKAAELKVIAFDKTGTLTTGKPQLTGVFPAEGVSEADLLGRVAAVENRSEHPIGDAIVRAAQERGLQLADTTDFRAIPGQGVEGWIDHRPLWVGNPRLFAERGVPVPPEIMQHVQRLEAEGQTVMLAYQDGRWLGLLTVADTLRPDAAEIVQRLKRAGIEKMVILTGDNERVARAVAAQSGVDEVYAGLLPQDKVRLLETLRQKYGMIAMVGDGVNDAPALAAADIGIAMGGAGSDVALEIADVVLMSDDLTNLPHAVALARRARHIIWQNLTFALAVIVTLVVSAFGLNLPLPLGVVGHEGSTVLVVLNGLRLLAFRKV